MLVTGSRIWTKVVYLILVFTAVTAHCHAMKEKSVNKRLQELATTAGISIEYLTNTKQITTLEKFAELIILEAADIATVNQHQWHCPGTYIKQHFGIEP